MSVVLNSDVAELVLRLACLTDDRSPDEERALVDLAFRIDQDRNLLTVTNPRVSQLATASDLVGELGFTLDKKQEATRQRRLAAWEALSERPRVPVPSQGTENTAT